MKKPSGATKNSHAKLAVKKTAAKGKAAKDPNKPKRPASAFFVFMEDFRTQFKEENPNVKSVAQVGKAGGAKWKAMSDSEKAPFQAKADKRKKEYEKSTFENVQEEEELSEKALQLVALPEAQSTLLVIGNPPLSEKALQLVALPEAQSTLLVIVCGSGLSGETISEKGHKWIGLDISRFLPDVGLERETDGDHGDIGQGVSIPPGGFDGAISTSAVQWLWTDKSCDERELRLKAFFRSVYGCLGTGARAVFTFYPETDAQQYLILRCAWSAGFGGGVVSYHPDSKKRKDYIVLTRGLSKLRC